MRRSLVTSMLSAVVLTLPTASLASAGPIPPAANVSDHGASTEITLPGQPCPGGQNMGRPNGAGIVSQDFEEMFDSWDAIGAADFTLRSKCRLGSIFVDGIGAAPDAVHWAVYTSTQSRQPTPDTLVSRCYGTVRLDGLSPNLEFDVPLRCALSSGVHYWLTIQARLDYQPGLNGWYWATTNQRAGNKDLWKNPGDGLLEGCVVWGPISCLDADFDSYDYRFSLRQYSA
jgi:hypothetical protein